MNLGWLTIRQEMRMVRSHRLIFMPLIQKTLYKQQMIIHRLNSIVSLQVLRSEGKLAQVPLIQCF